MMVHHHVLRSCGHPWVVLLHERLRLMWVLLLRVPNLLLLLFHLSSIHNTFELFVIKCWHLGHTFEMSLLLLLFTSRGKLRIKLFSVSWANICLTVWVLRWIVSLLNLGLFTRSTSNFFLSNFLISRLSLLLWSLSSWSSWSRWLSGLLFCFHYCLN